MKKIFILITLLPIVFFSTFTVKADSAWEQSFTDDFESYTVGKAESQTALTDVWTNDGWNESNDNASDVFDIATIKEEGGNKYLNMDYDSSFFYMAPTTMRAKEFAVEFDFRSHDLTDSWVGVVMRKEFRDTRYNGGTGMMFYFRTKYLTDNEENIIGESLVILVLRGGSLSTTDLNDQLVGQTVIEYIYPTEGEIDPAQQILNNWYTAKIVVSDTENAKEALYEVYINDVFMSSLTYSRSSLDIYGYFSLNSCVGDFDVDNFSIQSNDTVAPPPKVYVNKLIDSSGTVGEEILLPGGEEGDLLLIGDDDDIVEIEIIDPEQNSITLASGVFSFTPDMEGIYTVRYVVRSTVAGEGYEEFYISIQADSTTTTTTTTTEIVTTETLTTTGQVDNPTQSDFPTGLVLIIVGGLALVSGAVFVIIKFKK
ncbi:hypothetical protein ACAG96_07015 [Candidatus Izemoplasma sp. B36]|uniref:hypothetical protein n=1 Tax=Candidatus Izemoplasma sp. B36 TaxID=3242468 RepID=UPI0035570FA4